MGQEAVKNNVSPVEVFSSGSRLWWSKFSSLSTIYLIFYAPMLLLNGFIWILSGPVKPGARPTGLSLMMSLIGLLVGIWSAISFIIELGKKEQGGFWAKDIKDARTRFLPYAGAMILYYLFSAGLFILSAVLAGFIAGGLFASGKIAMGAIALAAFVIPAICVLVYFGIRWSLFGIVCVLESLSPVASLKRSYSLVRNYVTPLVGVYFLFGLVSVLAILPLFFMGGLFKTQQAAYMFGTAYHFLISLFLLPLWFAIDISFYSKIKEAVGRKEGRVV
jgi:hypothetical protein